MNSKTILKLIALNLGLLLANVAVFSKGILGFSIFSANVLIQAAAVTIPLASAALFGVGNYRLVKQGLLELPDASQNVLRLVGPAGGPVKPDNVREALKAFEKTHPSLREEIKEGLESLDSIDRKQEKMEKIFTKNDYDLHLARDELDTTEEVLCKNLKRMMNTMIIWEPEEENDPDKLVMYAENKRYINDILSVNGRMLDKADELLVEVVRYIDAKDAGIDQQEAGLVSTIDALKTLNGRAAKLTVDGGVKS